MTSRNWSCIIARVHFLLCPEFLHTDRRVDTGSKCLIPYSCKRSHCAAQIKHAHEPVIQPCLISVLIIPGRKKISLVSVTLSKPYCF